MAVFEDLKPCTYFGQWQDVLVAVGWLGVGHPYARGAVSGQFFSALVRLLVDAWQPVAVAGRSACPFCRFSGGPANLTYAGSTVALGATNLFVAADDKAVFVAPGLIAHYIDAHEYGPPTAFQEAVLGSSPMKSIGYMKEMKARGLIAQK
jgi:hypothetical protein